MSRPTGYIPHLYSKLGSCVVGIYFLRRMTKKLSGIPFFPEGNDDDSITDYLTKE